MDLIAKILKISCTPYWPHIFLFLTHPPAPSLKLKGRVGEGLRNYQHG
jgi:hypothetical protein